MKISESERFGDLAEALLQYYDWWDEHKDTPREHLRAFVGVGNDEETSVLMLFKGNRKDAEKVAKFIRRMEME